MQKCLASLAQTTIAAPPETVFDTVTRLEVFPKIFRGRGVVPAVERLVMIDGAPQQAGSQRLVINSDGSRILEEILVFERGTAHRYRLVSGFRFPLTLLVRSAEGAWAFEPLDAGLATRVTWRLDFNLTSQLARPLAGLIINRYMRPAMQEALERLRDLMRAGEPTSQDFA